MSQVLCFHGFLGQTSDFEFLKTHDAKFKIESVDYTRTPLLNTEVFLSDWGPGFWTWIEDRGILKPIRAIGYSQGGRLLLQAFAMAPEKFESLTLISTHPGLESFEEKELRLKNDRAWAKDFRTMDWNTLEQKWNSQPVFAGGKENPRNEKDFNRETLALCLENWSLAHQANFRDLIKTHQDKIKIILGSEDLKYIKIYEDLGVKFHTVRGAAHRVISDKPYETMLTL